MNVLAVLPCVWSMGIKGGESGAQARFGTANARAGSASAPAAEV